MKTNLPDCTKAEQTPTPRRRFLRVAALLAGLLCLAFVAVGLWSRHPQSPNTQPEDAQNVSTASGPSTAPVRAGAHHEVIATQPVVTSRPVYQQPEPTPAMRQMVNSVVDLNPGSGALTEEQALTWRTNLL